MELLGKLFRFPELAAIVAAIHGKDLAFRLPDGNRVYTGKMSNGNLFCVRRRGILYIEQNPNTTSIYAERARKGSQIVWVIRKTDSKYLGMIENGEVWVKDRRDLHTDYQKGGA